MTYAPVKGNEDNFGTFIANPEQDIVNSPGYYQFTPERRRVFRNDSRVFLQYGTDSRFSDTDFGIDLQPDSGDILKANTADRVPYTVGFDLEPSFSIQIPNSPQSGDCIVAGFGDPDVTNFDPSTKSYSSSSADGVFVYWTSDNGLSEVFVAQVRDGTIQNSVDNVSLNVSSDSGNRFEFNGNYYDIGPWRLVETFTDVANDRQDPQKNPILTSVANDDGLGILHPAKRITVEVDQDGSNSGLECEVGSLAAKLPGQKTTNFKTKDHTQTINNSNTTADTYEVVGVIGQDTAQSRVQLRTANIEVSNTPSSTAEAEVLVQAIDKSSTNYADAGLSTPPEHSPQNSVVRTRVGNTDGSNAPTGPDADDSGTDSGGATTANTMTNPGGYQIGRTKINQNKKSNTLSASGEKERVLNDTDFGLILIDANETGDYELEVTTRQNS